VAAIAVAGHQHARRGRRDWGDISGAFSPFWEGADTELDEVVQPLVERGMIESAGHGQWTLSSSGTALHAAASGLVSTIRDRLTCGVTLDVYRRTVDVLARMAANLEPEPLPCPT
jgi:hypothetical protein